MFRLWMHNDQPATMTAKHDDGQVITGTPGANPNDADARQGWQFFDFRDDTIDQWGCTLEATQPGFAPYQVRGPLHLEGDGALLFLDAIIMAPAGGTLPGEPPPTNGSGVVGCQNGRLQDPVAWFFNRIKRQIGMPADDWEYVLSNCGITAGGGPNEIIPIPDPDGTYGIRLQVGSGGPRGRWFAPSSTPDDLGYYTCEYQAITDDPARPGHFVWAHIVFKAGTYLAHPCPAAGTRAVDPRDTRPRWVPVAAP